MDAGVIASLFVQHVTCFGYFCNNLRSDTASAYQLKAKAPATLHIRAGVVRTFAAHICNHWSFRTKWLIVYVSKISWTALALYLTTLNQS